MTDYKLYPNLPSASPEALGPPLGRESSGCVSSQHNSGQAKRFEK